MDEIKSDVTERIHKWEDRSKELIGSFLSMFGGRTFEEIMNSSLVRSVEKPVSSLTSKTINIR